MRGYNNNYSSTKRQNSERKPGQMIQKRRVRTPWLDYEIQNLIMGVYNFGAGKWAIIHTHMAFQKNRTYIDLKDKWRNLIDRRLCARTPAIYRTIAVIIHKQQMKYGHKRPECILTKNDWQHMLQMYYSKIQDEMKKDGSNQDVLGSSSMNDEVEPEYTEQIVVPRKYEVKSFPIISIVQTIPQAIAYEPVKTVQPMPIIHSKIRSIQDFLW